LNLDGISTRALPDILWLLSSHRLTVALVVVCNRSNAPATQEERRRAIKKHSFQQGAPGHVRPGDHVVPDELNWKLVGRDIRPMPVLQAHRSRSRRCRRRLSQAPANHQRQDL